MRYISNLDVLRKKKNKKGTSVGFEATSRTYECRVFCMAVKSGESLPINLISFSNTICAIFTYLPSPPPPPDLVNMMAVDLLCTRNNETY